MTYSEKLRDPRWQKKRLQVMERDDFQCVDCISGSATLHVHHQYYIKGRDPWDYPNWSLLTLCKECHGIRHAWSKSTPRFEWWEEVMERFLGKGGDDCSAARLSDISLESERIAKSLGSSYDALGRGLGAMAAARIEEEAE